MVKKNLTHGIFPFVAVGGFDLEQHTEAQVAWFNMWSYKMTIDELNDLVCNSIGDTVSQNDMQPSGSSQLSYQTFYCKGKKYVRKVIMFQYQFGRKNMYLLLMQGLNYNKVCLMKVILTV